MLGKKLSKRDVHFSRVALKQSPDVIHRTSPVTGKLMEHIGDNTYRDVDTQEIYKAEGSVAAQSKQDQILYPLSA